MYVFLSLGDQLFKGTFLGELYSIHYTVHMYIEEPYMDSFAQARLKSITYFTMFLIQKYLKSSYTVTCEMDSLTTLL